jgi:hypothetical protein
MRIGIVQQYRRHEAVYAAMRLSDFITRLGHDVVVYSHGSTRRIPNLHPDWDGRVVSERAEGFDSFLSKCSVVIYPEPPPSDWVARGNRQGAKTVCLAPWDNLPPGSDEAFRISDVLVSPAETMADMVRDHFQLDNVRYVPWDCGLPITRKAGEDVSSERARVLFPLHCTLPHRTTAELVALTAMQVVESCPWVDATVTITPKCMSAHSLSNLHRVLAPPSKGGTVTVVEDHSGWSHTPLVYGRHDLVVVASEVLGFGMCVLESLCMGTPVVAYNASPTNEVIKQAVNGILMPCELTFNERLVPFVRPDWEQLRRVVVNLLNARTGIADLRRNSRLNLQTRRERFVAEWVNILGG